MRRFTSLLFSILPIVCFSQVNIINRSLTDSSLNIAYLGLDNAIELTGYKKSVKLIFLITNGTMTDIGQNRYVLRPKNEGECIISFHNQGNKIISKLFRIDTLGDMKIRLAGVQDSVASIHQILANPFLISEIPKSYYKSPVYITSFIATFIGEKFDSVRTNAMGNLFTQEQIDIIKQLRQRDKILFQDVYFFWPDGRRRKYPPFVIAIK